MSITTSYNKGYEERNFEISRCKCDIPYFGQQMGLHVQVIPNRFNITIVRNNENERVPTCIQTSYRCAFIIKNLTLQLVKIIFLYHLLIKC